MNKINLSIKPNDYMTTEAYKTLRTNLQFCGEEKKVISITSCTPNEGKSLVSLNLSQALAESGKRTLLLDADMRRSVLAGETKPSKAGLRGLAHFLSGQSELSEVISLTNIPNLSIVYSGPFPPNPAELLNGNRFMALLRAVRKTYDYVIIDAPPIGSVIDGAIIAEKSDGVIFVIEAGVISYRLAQNLKEQIERSGTPILGAVLNKVDMQKSTYGKYYGKYYSKYYGEKK